MTRILLEDAHAQAGSGAPGERDYSRALNDKIVPLLAARGIETVRVGGTTQDQPVYHEDYLCFVTNHYDADIYAHAGGGFWGRADQSATAPKDDALAALIWAKYRTIPGAPADHFERRNANTRDYYAFRYTSANTPGVIFEWGVGAPNCNGHGAPTAPDHDWLRASIDRIAQAVAEGVLAFHIAQGEEDDMTPAQFREWFLALYRELEVAKTLDAMKAIEGQLADQVRTLAAGEMLDDVEVAALKARIDKLRTI